MRLLKQLAPMLCGVMFSMLLSAPAAAGEVVGVRQLTVPSQERGGDLSVTIWYPADAGGLAVTLGESAFFVGTAAWLEAPVSSGKYPLIVLSHGAGLGGTPLAMSWLATPLAQQGFIVAAPTHPGNAGMNRSAAETMKLWLRAGDIGATLDALEQQPLFKKHLEAGRVGVLGLSMGGHTALALAGARIEPIRLASYCDSEAHNPSLCQWVRQSGVNLHAMDMHQAARNHRDARINFAMAIDPVPLDVFQVDSFSTITIPVAIVQLGQAAAIPQTAQAAGIAKAISKSTYAMIEDASHYSMLAACKAGASERALSEKIDDPRCSDGAGRSRQEIHQRLIGMATEAFSRALKPVP
jgi:predicted dienelactone hydrolase